MRLAAFPLIVVVLALSGCTPFNHEKTVELLPGQVQAVMDVDGPTYEQTLTVTIKSDKGGVDAFLVKESDKKEVEKALDAIKNYPKDDLLLGSHKGGDGPEDYEFEGKVAARQAFTLILRNKGTAKNSVTVKVVGR